MIGWRRRGGGTKDEIWLTCADVAIPCRGKPDDGPEDGESPGKAGDDENMVLDPGGGCMVIGEDKVCAYTNGQHPVVGLDDKDLGHETVVGAETLVLGVADILATHVHGG